MSNRRKHVRAQHKPKRRGSRRQALPYAAGEIAVRPGEIQEIRAAAKISDDSWDVILVGDGSARSHGGACGWSTLLYDKDRKSRRVFFGATSEGSCLMSELIPYVQAMLWFDRFRGAKLRREKKMDKLKVVVVTDCKVLAAQGQRLAEWIDDPRRLRSTRAVWLVLRHLAEVGYTFEWCWVRRGTLTPNREMNTMSQAVRHRMERQQEDE